MRNILHSSKGLLVAIALVVANLCFVGEANAAIYYLQNANVASASTPGSWRTDATGGGGGTAAPDFTTNGDVFNTISGQSATFTSNITLGSSGGSGTCVTMNIVGGSTATLNSGVVITLASKGGCTTALTVSGTIVFSTTGANQINESLGSNGTATFTLSSGATLKTVNANGVVGASGSIASLTTPPSLTTGANYEFNGAAQVMTGTPATVNNLIFSGSGAKTFLGTLTTVSGNLTMSGTATTTTTANLTISGNLSPGDGTTFTVAGFALTVTGTTTVGGGTSGNLTITSATGTKTFAGLVTVASGGTWTNTAANSPVTFRGGITNNGTFNAGTGIHTFDTNNQALTGTFSIPSVTVTGITLTNNNTLTVSTALSGTGGLTQSASATLNIGGSSGITTLTSTASSNTVNYTGSAQTVHSNNYYHLTLSGSGTDVLQTGTTAISGNLTLSGTVSTTTVVGLTITGNLSIGNGTTFTVAGFDLTVTGTSTVGGGTSGNLTISSATGTKTFTGLLTVASGGTWTNTAANSAVTFRGGITNNGTFNAGTGIHTFNTNNQALTGTFSIPSVTVTAITLTNNNTLTVGTALSGTGGLTQAPSATLNIGGTSGITTLTATASSNTVNYNGAAQTIIATTYFNLSLNGSGNKDFGASTTTIAGTLDASAGTMVPNGGTVVFTGTVGSMTGSNGKNFFNLQFNSGAVISNSGSGNITVGGNYTNNGTSFTQLSTNTITFDATSGTQTLSGSGSSIFGSYAQSGAKTVDASAHSFTVSGSSFNATNASGIFKGDGGTATVTFSGSTTFGTGPGAITFNNVTISGTLINNANNKSFNIKGSWTNNGTYTKGTETITFNGSSAQTIGGSASTTFNNLTIANTSGGVSLTQTQTVSGTLTLTSGILTTDATNIIHVTNTATSAVSAGSGSKFIKGPLKWSISTGTYLFPVGKSSSNYFPFTLVTSAASSPIVTIEAFDTDAGAGATFDATLTAISHTEYWQATLNSGTFTGKVSLTRINALGALDVIGKSTAQGGTYTSIGGTAASPSINNSNDISSFSYFAMATSVKNCPFSTAVTPSADQTVCQGFATNQLTATITTTGGTGNPTFQYQWYYNTTNSNTVAGATLISGATSQTYTPLSGAPEAGTTRYYFCVGYATNNGCGQTNGDQSLASNTVKVTVNPLPTITLGTSPSVCQGSTSANLPYSATTNSPNQYSIDYNAAAETAGFVDVTNATLPATPIVLVVPGAAAAATYNATLTVRNSTTGCVSSPSTAFTVTVLPRPTSGTCTNADDKCQVNTGEIKVTASGGTGLLNITWTAVLVPPFTGPITGTPAGSAQPVPNTPGVGGFIIYSMLSGNTTYSFVVTDANGCLAP